MRNLNITPSITNRESQSVEIYFNEIGKVKLISAEEEVALAQKIRQGDKAALERLCKANLRFVVSIAKKYQQQGLPLSDLISEGNLGLIKAARKFDDTRGFKFISFAVWWIRQSILSAISEQTRMIRLPQNQINLLTKINKATAVLENELEYLPTDDDIADFIDVPKDKIEETRYYSGRTTSYDTPLNAEQSLQMIDVLWDRESNIEIEHKLLSESKRQVICYLLDSLAPRERQVIELTFGLSGEWPLTPSEAGKLIGMSGERIRQIKMNVLDKLAVKVAGTSSQLS